TRRASFTESREQQGRSGRSPSWQKSFIVAPTTSYPCSTSIAAATDESTPPDIATSTRSFVPLISPCSVRGVRVGVRHAARLLHERGKYLCHALDAAVGRQTADAHANRRRRELWGDADRAQHVRRRYAPALTG